MAIRTTLSEAWLVPPIDAGDGWNKATWHLEHHSSQHTIASIARRRGKVYSIDRGSITNNMHPLEDED